MDGQVSDGLLFVYQNDPHLNSRLKSSFFLPFAGFSFSVFGVAPFNYAAVALVFFLLSSCRLRLD